MPAVPGVFDPVPGMTRTVSVCPLDFRDVSSNTKRSSIRIRDYRRGAAPAAPAFACDCYLVSCAVLGIINSAQTYVELKRMIPKTVPDSHSNELQYSRGAGALWATRLRHVLGALLLMAVLVGVVIVALRGEFALAGSGLVLALVCFRIMAAGLNNVYALILSPDKLLLQSAFWRREIPASEVKDAYQPACGWTGGNIWTIKTAHGTYPFEAKDVGGWKFMETLLARIEQPPSQSWIEYQISPRLEISSFVPCFLLAVAVIAGSFFGHSYVIAALSFVILCLYLGALHRTARKVVINPNGIDVTNLFRQKKTIPWQSMTSIKRNKLGFVQIDSTQGHTTLSSVDGANVLLKKVLQHAPRHIYIDYASPKNIQIASSR